jgi:hypothetical protein
VFLPHKNRKEEVGKNETAVAMIEQVKYGSETQFLVEMK